MNLLQGDMRESSFSLDSFQKHSLTFNFFKCSDPLTYLLNLNPPPQFQCTFFHVFGTNYTLLYNTQVKLFAIWNEGKHAQLH